MFDIEYRPDRTYFVLETNVHIINYVCVNQITPCHCHLLVKLTKLWVNLIKNNLQISALWREKFLSGVSYSVDSFGYVVLMHLLWPGRSQQYFILAAGQVNIQIELTEANYRPIFCPSLKIF